jgi:FkbM family methyltransferase
MIGLDFFLKFYPRESELTIFDVGAHHGESVNEFITLYPNSRIFAFEPDKANFARLNERFARMPQIYTFNKAVGRNDGNVLLHKNNYDATHSLLPFDHDEINRWADANDFIEIEIAEVDQVALDRFCADRNIGKIDILKLDVQGGEMMALEGAGKKLSQQAIEAVFCEVEFCRLYKNQPLFWDITAYLLSLSYHFVTIVSPKTSELGVLSWADAIYVNDPLWQYIAGKHSAGKLIG